MRIVITGTPATGKSKLALLLSKKLDLELIDLKKIATSSRIVTNKHEVDMSKLAKKLAFLKNKNNYVVEGHFACEIKIPCEFIFVLRCDPKILKRRLLKRKYGSQKISENLLAEMLDYCTQRVQSTYGRNPLELDTSSRTSASCLRLMETAIKHKKKRIDNVNYSNALKDYLIGKHHEGRETTNRGRAVHKF